VYSKDIAKLAGVSRSTVSRVVNKYTNVSAETKEKVSKIIKKYHYIPHGPARTLAGKHNKVIGVFITNIGHEDERYIVFQNTYLSPFTGAVIDCADKLEYNILVSIIDKNNDFKKIEELFNNKTLSGGIFIGACKNPPEILNLVESGHKLVIIDQDPKYQNRVKGKYIIVNSNNFEGACIATEHLIELGHKNIAHICGDMKKLSGSERLKGYKTKMKESGLKIRKDFIINGDFTEKSGYISAKKLLNGKRKNKVTGIFCSNDAMAIGAIKAAVELRLRVPEDISIIGYDDTEISSYISPPLTTIGSSIQKIAAVATKNVIDFIENGIDSSKYYIVPTKLIERKSTKKLVN
jgi:LacI family transcriptional regulator